MTYPKHASGAKVNTIDTGSAGIWAARAKRHVSTDLTGCTLCADQRHWSLFAEAILASHLRSNWPRLAALPLRNPALHVTSFELPEFGYWRE